MNDLYAKGAHFVLGTTKKMTFNSLSVFLKNFIEQLNLGKSIADALDVVNIEDSEAVSDAEKNQYSYYEFPDSASLLHTGVFPSYYVGDMHQCLN